MRRRTGFVGFLVPLLAALLFAVVAPQRAAAAPAAADLRGVPVTAQVWSLSCEYAATSAATAYYGKKITQQTFREAIGASANPHKGFRGDIAGVWGGTTNYGIYAEPILPVLQQWGFGRSYIFYGGAETLKQEVASGHPVVVWITGTYAAQGRTSLTDSNGARFSLVRYEHAVTVTGYDAGGVTVMDPGAVSSYRVSWAKFDTAWAQLDRMALVVAQ